MASIAAADAMNTPIFDLALIIGLFVSASGCGMWLLDIMRIHVPSRVCQFLFATGLGLGLLGYVNFALGMLALYQRPVIAASFLVLLFIGLWRWHRCGHLAFSISRDCWTTFCRLSWPSKVLIGYLAIVASINLLAALAPVIGVDELIYRLAAAKLYLRHGRLMYIPSMVFHQQPQHIQMIQLWGMALGSESSAQVVQWGMGVLLLLALVDLARHEMPPTWALLSGAVFYTYSDVIVMSGRASPDLANGFFMALAIIAWLKWLKTDVNRWLIAAGIFSGLFAAGARLPGAYGAISLAALVFIVGWRQRRWKFLVATKYSLGLGMLAFLMVAPWYARSYLQTGNPVWPFLATVFGARDWTTATYNLFTANYSQQEVGRWLSVGRIFTAPWHLTMRPEQFHSGVAGPLMLATLPLAFIVRLPRRLQWLLAACGILGIMWYVSYPRLRAFIPGVAFLSMIVGYLLWRLWLADVLPLWVRVSAMAIALMWLFVGLGTAMRFHLRAAGVTLGLHQENKYLAQRLTEPDMKFYWFDDYKALNRIIPAENRLLIYETRGYHLEFDYDYYTLIARRTPDTTRLRDQDFVAQQVRALGSDYVLLWPEPQQRGGSAPNNLLEDTLHDLCGTRWPIVYQSSTMIACRVTSLP